jgi:hypothetical protein
MLLTVVLATAVLISGAAQEIAPPTSSPETVDLIATLNTVCIAAQGDAARAADLAAEAGYSPMPASMIPPLRNGSEQAAFMKSNATDVAFIMTGKMNRRVGREQIVMDVCGVSVRPTEHRALDQRLRQTMGFAPVTGIGMEAYAWLQTPEGRAPTRDLSDRTFVAMAGTGQMRMVGLDRAGPGSTLMYFLPRLD